MQLLLVPLCKTVNVQRWIHSACRLLSDDKVRQVPDDASSTSRRHFGVCPLDYNPSHHINSNIYCIALKTVYLMIFSEYLILTFRRLTSTIVDVRTAKLQNCILYIYSKNIETEYFKHDVYSPFFYL